MTTTGYVSTRGAVFDDRLTTLWKSGMSTSQMGEMLGVTKNVIVGCRTRLQLEARVSPIVRGSGGEKRPNPPPRVRHPRTTLPEACPPETGFSPSLALPPKDLWLQWFNQQPKTRRRHFALVRHAAACPTRTGGGLWDCLCGASQPKNIPAVKIALENAQAAPLEASDHPQPVQPVVEPPPFGDVGQDDDDDDDDDPNWGESEEDEAGDERDAGALTPEQVEEEEEEARYETIDSAHPHFDRIERCCFPKESGKRKVVYCDAPITTPRASYCEEHQALTHLKDSKYRSPVGNPDGVPVENRLLKDFADAG